MYGRISNNRNFIICNYRKIKEKEIIGNQFGGIGFIWKGII